MADTRVQLEVEDWVREKWMQDALGQPFFRNRVKLSSGGVFDFDALSGDRSIVACISTSAGKTSGGKNGVGKLMKLRSDMLFLTMAEGVTRRLLVLTERDMHEVCAKELSGGRVPAGIEILLADIPADLRERLDRARQVASQEVDPKGKKPK
jgi:hypothetical protein